MKWTKSTLLLAWSICAERLSICYILYVSEAEVTQRMSHVNEVANRASGYNRHEELAKKLQEEMEKKRKMTPALKSDAPSQRMKEVECPTCTVHLQVEVPATGSKTIECSVCQHPFLFRSVDTCNYLHTEKALFVMKLSIWHSKYSDCDYGCYLASILLGGLWFGPLDRHLVKIGLLTVEVTPNLAGGVTWVSMALFPYM
ncbi:hypothetical protein Tco_0262117 [Tanacetum coccineum]